MQITEQLRKPVKEVNYLNVENTDRYRPILRFFYLKYERMKYWLYQEDVYEALREDPYFAHYTIEQCQQDLATLAGWAGHGKALSSSTPCPLHQRLCLGSRSASLP